MRSSTLTISTGCVATSYVQAQAGLLVYTYLLRMSCYCTLQLHLYNLRALQHPYLLHSLGYCFIHTLSASCATTLVFPADRVTTLTSPAESRRLFRHTVFRRPSTLTRVSSWFLHTRCTKLTLRCRLIHFSILYSNSTHKHVNSPVRQSASPLVCQSAGLPVSCTPKILADKN